MNTASRMRPSFTPTANQQQPSVLPKSKGGEGKQNTRIHRVKFRNRLFPRERVHEIAWLSGKCTTHSTTARLAVPQRRALCGSLRAAKQRLAVDAGRFLACAWQSPRSVDAPGLDNADSLCTVLRALLALLGRPLLCKLPSSRSATFGPQPAGRGTPC